MQAWWADLDVAAPLILIILGILVLGISHLEGDHAEEAGPAAGDAVLQGGRRPHGGQLQQCLFPSMTWDGCGQRSLSS